jgi:FKBP-type peptidyl-prolyl cis-trans isomerase
MKDKKTIIVVLISIVVVGLLIGGGLIGGLFTSNKTQENNTMTTNTNSQLQIKDTQEGTGAVAVAGKTVTVHYTGVFADGKKFDSSVDRGTPFTFTLGSGMVIKGWDIGVEGMKVGGKRILVIPPDLAYGPNDYGPIPGNSTLIFEIELLDVK